MYKFLQILGTHGAQLLTKSGPWGRIKENTIRGEISRCLPLFVCFHYLCGKSKITSYMASYTEEFPTLHLIALSLNSKATMFFLEINSSPYP